MIWNAVKEDLSRLVTDLLVFTVNSHERRYQLDRLPVSVRRAFENSDMDVFSAESGTWVLLPCQDLAANWILLVGLGAPDEISLVGLRKAAGLAAGKARQIKAARCAWIAAGGMATNYDSRTLARCWVEGAEMALSPTGELKGDRSEQGKSPAADPTGPPPHHWLLVTSDGRELRSLRRGIIEGQAFAAGCLFARQLVNLPGNYLTPAGLAAAARKMARAEGLRCRTLGPAQLRRQQMGGLLGVAQGSREEPRLIVLESSMPEPPPRRRRRIALVGKGVTFDAGGISLKPPPKMDQMKYDMAGAAAVLGAALTISRLALPVQLLVIVPAAENLPSGTALKPGDVLTMASGRTVEVLNTDAEGRLILADALHYAGRSEPDYIIDAATLTGACVLALGRQFAGLLSTSAELIEVLTQAGGETGELVWQLPLIQEHHESLESEVADLKNLGPREGGALTAAAFLGEFVPPAIPWAHLDIAGPVWVDKAGPLGPKGATGFGSRLLARAVEILVS